MTERQTHGAGLVVVSLFAAVLIGGLALGFALPSQTEGQAPVRSAEPAESASTQELSSRQFVLQPGWRVEQVAEALEKTSITDGPEFMDRVSDPELVAILGTDGTGLKSLEGYLLPGVYEIPDGASEEWIVKRLVSSFRNGITPTLRKRADELGLSLREVVTLASIVERETVYYSDSPVIAGVYLNRLRAGMPLQADPTLAYAIDSSRTAAGETTRYWQRELTNEDLSFPSPFNTYLNGGLPPGPIASPSAEAIRAVLYPAESDYYFFVATGSGVHAFASTFEEHVSNLEEASRTDDEGALRRLIERVMEPVDGHVGVAVKNLDTGESAYLNAEDLFTTASLYKLAVMAAAFQWEEQGKLSFDEVLTIPSAAAERDSTAATSRLGSAPTVRHAIEEMIVVSSNAAGEALLEKLGRQEVDRVVREMGMDGTWLSTRRLISTPRDVAHLLELIATGQAVSSDASSEMLEILLRQEINDRLPKNLPEGTLLAHKTGSLDYASHDAGILFTSLGPVVIVVMTEAAADRAAATESLVRLGEHVFQYFETYSPEVHQMQAAGNPACPENPFSAQEPGRLSGRSIVLDPGHGGTEAGTTYRFADGSGLAEKDITLDVALRVKELLVEEGATVYLTRCRDTTVPLMARPAFVNSLGSDLLISIHLNGSDDPDKDGTEVYHFSQDGNVAANYLLGAFTAPALWETLNTGLTLPNRGTRQEDFTVLLYSQPPSVLTESLFLTNPMEAAALRNAADGPSRRQEIARGHFLGILNYFSSQ